MTDGQEEPTLLERLDRTQDEILAGLDDLNERIMSTLAAWNSKDVMQTNEPTVPSAHS